MAVNAGSGELNGHAALSPLIGNDRIGSRVGPKVGLDAVDRRSNFVALAGIGPAIPLTPSLSLVSISLTLAWPSA
jgi:hypothetical protein